MEHKVINSVEALLFGSGRPIRLSEIKSILENTGLSVELSEIKRAINDLEMRYEGTSLKVTEVASGYRLQIKEDHGHILSALWNEKAPRVSKALMETISIIAFPLVGILTRRLGKRIKKASTESQEETGTLASILSENLDNFLSPFSFFNEIKKAYPATLAPSI